MNYSVETNKTVKKFLEKCDAHIAKSFMHKAKMLAENPRRTDIDTCKLQGESNNYRLRIGKYRFLYTIIDEQILIYFFEADGRGDVYK